jgi:hypothetical protein
MNSNSIVFVICGCERDEDDDVDDKNVDVV